MIYAKFNLFGNEYQDKSHEIKSSQFYTPQRIRNNGAAAVNVEMCELLVKEEASSSLDHVKISSINSNINE